MARWSRMRCKQLARTAIQPKSVNPGPRAAWFDLQIETGAVVMQANLGEGADLCFSELLDEACHVKSPCGPYPRSTASIRLTARFATLFRAIWTLWKRFLPALPPPGTIPNPFSISARDC